MNWPAGSSRARPAQLKAGIALATGLSLVAIFFIQGIIFIRANAPTYDEAMHLAAGYSYLATGDFRLEPQNPPLIKSFLAMPLFLNYRFPFLTDAQQWRDGEAYQIGQHFVFHSTLSADRIMLFGRLPNLLLGGVLIGLTGWWAFRLWGTGPAAIAIALGCLDPNLVAHSSLVTTDIGASLFMLLTLYLLWEYRRIRSGWFLAGVGISLGVALVCKFSTVLLLPIIGLIMTLSLFLAGMDRSGSSAREKRRDLDERLFKAAAALLLILLFAALVIPSAYFFNGFEPWLSGLRRFLTLAREGQPAFFLGNYSYQGWWSYYVVAFLIKTPVGTLLLIAGSLIFYRHGRPLERHQAIFLLLPVIVILLAMTQSKVNIGLRHILPIYPFLFVLAARLATVSFEHRWIRRFLIGAPIILTAVSALRIAPHQLAYFNELVGGPQQGYRYLSDSNLDWGQDLKGVKTYMLKEKLPIIYLSYFGTAPPSYYGIRYQYVPGAWPLEWPPPIDKVPADAPRKILAIGASNLHDVATPYDPLFRWLQTRRPIEKIGYSIFIYDLTDDREGLIKLEESYIKAGLRLPL